MSSAAADETATSPATNKTIITFVTIRDPDYENETYVHAPDNIEIISVDVDLGSMFDGIKNIDCLDIGDAETWLEDTLESVAHLPANDAGRLAVEGIVEQGQEVIDAKRADEAAAR